MSAIAGDSSFAGSPLTWNLLFARQPEPDLEFTEEELEQTTNIRSSSPIQSPKKSGGSPLLWILLLVVVGGGAYAYMEPEMIMDLVGPLLGETPVSQQQPPVAMRPAPSMPPAGQREPAASAPTPPPAPTPQAVAPTPAPALEPRPSATAPSAPAPIVPPKSAGTPAAGIPAPPIIDAPVPLFGEGQLVAVLPDPVAPDEKVTLMQDAAGTKSGPAIPPGTVLTILDGDLQNGHWVYAVRSNYGTKGWIAEKQLKLKQP
ncbi:MAG TPA: hypothetical protein VD738_06775 [Nitrospira sp.]|nr:hypothetical protein [Nitrospira sp.]